MAPGLVSGAGTGGLEVSMMGGSLGHAAGPAHLATSFRLCIPMKRLCPLPLPWLLLGAAALHVALGFLLGLTGDEAHYALYGAHPDWSYYDHPPLVGWIQAPLVALDAPDGVLRLVPLLLWGITAVAIHASTRLIEGLDIRGAGGVTGEPTQAGLDAGGWAVLAYALTPLFHVLGIGLLPDSLLMLFTALLMWQCLRLLDEGRAARVMPWLVLGALLGLAGLSKYTAIFAALPVLAVVLSAHGTAVLRRPGPWLALALAALLVVPVFYWNARHDWISFAYQLHHGSGGHWSSLPLLQFLVIQFVLYPLGFLALWSLPGVSGSAPRALAWSLLAFFALPFALLAYLSGGGTSLPHWTAPAWVGLAPFIGLALSRRWQQGRRLAIRIAAAWQGLLTITLFVLMLSAGLPWMQGSRAVEPINPFSDFYGWDQAARLATRLAQARQISDIAVQNWTLASRLAWYVRPLPVHVLSPDFDQFTLWTGPLPEGRDALVVDWSQLAFEKPVGPGQFAQCEDAGVLPVQRGGRMVSHFTFWICRGWGGNPAPRELPP